MFRTLDQTKKGLITLLGVLFLSALGAFLFTPIAHGIALPPECPGTIDDYNVIIGTAEGETLKGTIFDDFIYGNGGNDTILGNGGNDCILSDGGNDTITTSGGNDVILVGGENNIVHAGNGDNLVIAGDGRDNITTGDGKDVIYAGDGNNAIRSGGGDDKIYAGDGNDYINGGDGIDFCNGGGGLNIFINCETQSETTGESGGNEQGGNNDGNSGTDSGGSNNQNSSDETGGNPNNNNEDTSEENQDSGEGGEEDGDSGSGGETAPKGPMVGNGIILSGGGGGVPPVTVREESLLAPVPGRVIVSWRTNIPATSQVYYGTFSSNQPTPPHYGYPSQTREDQYLTTDHMVEIGGIDPNQKYYFLPVSDVSNSTEGAGKELVYEPEKSENLVLALEINPTHKSSEVVIKNITDELIDSNTPLSQGSVSADVVSNNEPQESTIQNTEEEKDEAGELALLFGILPISIGQFIFYIIALLLIFLLFFLARDRGHGKKQKTGINY